MKSLFGKRAMALLIAFVMLFSCVPFRVLAAEEEKKENERDVIADEQSNPSDKAEADPEMADYTPIDWESIWSSLENQQPVDMDNLPEQQGAIVPDEDMVMDSIVDETPIIESQEQPELNQEADDNFRDRCGNVLVDWAINKILDWSLEKIMGQVFKDTSPTMQDLFKNQEAINRKMDIIMREVKLSDYKEDMRNKQTALVNIYKTSERTVNFLTKNTDANTRMVNMKPLYKGDGKDFCTDVINFSSTYLTEDAKRMPNGCIFNVYDLYSKNYYPWENQGYGFRENMRNLDIAEFYQSAAIALIACKAHIDSDSPLKASAEATYDQLTQAIKKVGENTKKFPIKHLPANETLFQVPGKETHYIWNTNLDRYTTNGYMDWNAIGKSDLDGLKGQPARWVLSDMTINSGSLNNNKYSAPSGSDYKQMIDYYISAGQPKKLGDIMADSGKVPEGRTVYPTNSMQWNNKTFTNDYRFICGGVYDNSRDGRDTGFFLGKYWLDAHDEAARINRWGSDRHTPDDVKAARIFIVR